MTGVPRVGERPILLRNCPSPRKKIADGPTIRRSAGTLPKYASFTIGPIAVSGPCMYGMAIVVAGDGLNMPRIQVETRPDSGRHAAVPAFLTALDDSNATARTAGGGARPPAPSR